MTPALQNTISPTVSSIWYSPPYSQEAYIPLSYSTVYKAPNSSPSDLLSFSETITSTSNYPCSWTFSQKGGFSAFLPLNSNDFWCYSLSSPWLWSQVPTIFSQFSGSLGSLWYLLQWTNSIFWDLDSGDCSTFLGTAFRAGKFLSLWWDLILLRSYSTFSYNGSFHLKGKVIRIGITLSINAATNPHDLSMGIVKDSPFGTQRSYTCNISGSSRE